ncbi:MAG: BamA/TamA family outer membrane protein [Acidobacteria bacterium]|nr:BamA/TamA family outer membrane protein [Acidobacteriota bacterium]
MRPLILSLVCTLLLNPLTVQPASSADRQTRPKIGLALSGGGARAAAHIGVLKVLEREGIPIDCITGTSFGALAGGLFSAGYSAQELERILLGQDWNTIFSGAPQRHLTPLMERRIARYQAQVSFRGWEPELPTGLLGGQRLTQALDVLTTSRMLQANFDFDNLPIQFRAISTNLIDGKPFIFKEGSMTEALRASIAVPFLFTPLEKDGMLLVDGGLVNNLPVDVARSLGADIVIAVDATSPLLEKDEINNFVDVIDQSISLQMERNVEENRRLATMVLTPHLDKISNTDYDRLPLIVRRGEEEADRYLDKIRLLVGQIKTRPELPSAGNARPVIGYISFRGLNRIAAEQLESSLKISAGQAVDPELIEADVARLYATRLFDSVRYDLVPIGRSQYQLVFILKEAALQTLGVSLRYDNEYDFVALGEFTARQLFKTPSSAALSIQFGGIENYFTAFRYVPSHVPFFFVEPRADAYRLERLDIRDKTTVDRFIDRREGLRLVIGGSLSRHIEMSAGVQAERVRISGGSFPNVLAGSNFLTGLLFRLNHDSLDDQEFPRRGANLRFVGDKRTRALGGVLDYSKWTADYRHFLPLTERATLQLFGTAGHSRGSVPFYDQFFIGGYYFSEIGSRPFLGLERDELTARQMAIFGASYRRQIFSNAFGFFRRGFLTGTYNGIYSSPRETTPYDLKLFNGFGVGAALDSVIGPVRATVAWGEGGRFNFYISLGPAF